MRAPQSEFPCQGAPVHKKTAEPKNGNLTTLQASFRVSTDPIETYASRRRRLVDTERREPLVCSAAQSRKAQSANGLLKQLLLPAIDLAGLRPVRRLTGRTWAPFDQTPLRDSESSLPRQGTCASCSLAIALARFDAGSVRGEFQPCEAEDSLAIKMLQKSWPTKTLTRRLCSSFDTSSTCEETTRPVSCLCRY